MSDIPDDLFSMIQDALGDVEVIQADIESTLQDDLPPQATYTTNPDEYPVSASVTKFEAKTDARGRELPARTMIRFSGMAFATVKEKAEKLRFEFQISPQKQKKREFERNELSGKNEWTGQYLDADDIQTKLYAQANQVYRNMNGEYPKKVVDLVSFLVSTPFRMRTFNTQDGKTIVMALSSTKRG